MALTGIDLAILGVYAVALVAIAYFVSREKAGHSKDTEDYFLAGRSLPWWSIGASLIAANISAEQIIGQSGQGYAVGLAIAAYEWQAAIVLLIVAKFFLPIFLERGVYTMPQFLDQRYGGGVKTLMSVYWIVLYTAVNLTTVLWLGGLAVTSLTGLPVFAAMACLAGFAALYSLYGGLKAVALTDIIQVVILIVGGAAITWIALDLVGGDAGAAGGLARLGRELPGHFSMILAPDHPSYGDLPGVWTLLGGLWVLHFSYWGFNQYIIQRALAAESLPEAQKGLAFAAALKLFIPLIVVIPGIAAVMLVQDGVLGAATLDPAACAVPGDTSTCGRADRTYGELMTLAPPGLRGLVFAALVAAVVSSLASMMNSISTIFTMDVYRAAVPDRPQTHYVGVGRITAFVAMAAALVLAQPFIGGFESGFQTVQEYTGFIAPGVVAIFLMGFFWSRATTLGAYGALLGSVGFSVAFKLAAPDLPFVIRIWFVFLACLAMGGALSFASRQRDGNLPVALGGIEFGTRAAFNLAAAFVTLALIAIYVVYW
ncbi:MAG: sodium/solute symporter [Alphaproteobacteria bacterium]|nr:sodium/solute symporter [Alphaproteobacteria bacterium]